MNEYQKIDCVIGEVIEHIKYAEPDVRERRIEQIVSEMAPKCNANFNYLNYFLDPKKDKDLLKKLISVRILGEVIIYSDSRVTEYLLKSLKDKTNLELYLGSNIGNSKITAYLSTVTTVLGGFALGFFSARRFGGIVNGSIVGGIAAGVVGGCTTYKLTQPDFQYIDKAELRKYAAHSLARRKSTLAILEGLNERIKDNYEDQAVKKAAQQAIDQLQSQKELQLTI